MQKETILAKVNVHMDFTEEIQYWFEKLADYDVWFTHKKGIAYLSEMRGRWVDALKTTVNPQVHSFFLELGVPQDRLPYLKVYESYPGSWIIDAAIVMAASMGTAYTILKSVSELPQIADGLTELKDRLKEEFKKITNKFIREDIFEIVDRQHLPPPPSDNFIDCDFTIDARPLLSLTPSEMKSHKIHLNVAISRDALTIENLGDEPMKNIRIGIFKSSTQRNQWAYADSYTGIINILSPGQTITKDTSEFRSLSGKELDLSEPHPLHVDCWIQDEHGIYLFLFYLEN